MGSYCAQRLRKRFFSAQNLEVKLGALWGSQGFNPWLHHWKTDLTLQKRLLTCQYYKLLLERPWTLQEFASQRQAMGRTQCPDGMQFQENSYHSAQQLMKVTQETWMSSPGGPSGKDPACQCRRHRTHCFDPWVGKSPREGNGKPLQYSCLENPKDRGDWWATTHGVAKSWRQLKWLSMHTCYHRLTLVSG